MQELIIEFCLVALISFIIGIGSSMVGISGGAFKTPVLIIIFGLGAQFSTGVSLFTALFLALPSSIEYNRNEKKPINIKVGLIITLLAIPGLFLGVILKTWMTDDYLFRFVFGAALFPVAIMMLLTRRNSNGSNDKCEVQDYTNYFDNKPRVIIAALGFFISGISAGLLGIGGGTLNVPIMCLILGMPMLSATATSVFAIIFISSAGTIMNLMFIPEMYNIPLFLFYSSALGVGFIFGSKLGADYACSIDGVHLRRFFGALLVFPLIHLMGLGQAWLDPQGENLLLATLGDLLIWSFIVIPAVLTWNYWEEGEKGYKQIESETS